MGNSLRFTLWQGHQAPVAGRIAVGHVRYATTGSNAGLNAQPFVVNHAKYSMALAHNGNLTNADMLRRELEMQGAIFSTTSDTEVICYIITKERINSASIEEAVKKMGYTPKGSFQSMAEKPSYEEARKLAEELMDAFVQGQTDRIVLVYHHFKSTGTQILLKENFLPIDLQQAAASEGEAVAATYNSDYIVEPAADRLVAELLPKVLCQKIYTMLLDSVTSEHAARMMAMQTATDNADDLIQELTIQYNKTRQQSITNELLDIIGGSMK